MKTQFATGLTVLVLLIVATASADITELRVVNGKLITCSRGGLHSDVDDCGVRPEFYSYVLTGRISAIHPLPGDEHEIQIAPEEIFAGTPPNPLVIKTSQSLCLSEKPTVGDRWLFHLYRDPQGGESAILSYGHVNGSVNVYQKLLEHYRRLRDLGDTGLVSGTVRHEHFSPEDRPIPNVQVAAQRASGDTRYITIADADGHYEFPPLPAGEYTFSAQSGSWQADTRSWHVKARSCVDLTLAKSSDVRINIRVRHRDGSPISGALVLIVHDGKLLWNSYELNKDGTFRSYQRPGKYVLGIILPGAPSLKYGGGAGIPAPPASLYYPGVPSRADADVISLAEGDKERDIEFTIP